MNFMRNSNTLFNVFVKPNEQSGACSDSAMVRKRRMKSNPQTMKSVMPQKPILFLCFFKNKCIYMQRICGNTNKNPK